MMDLPNDEELSKKKKNYARYSSLMTMHNQSIGDERWAIREWEKERQSARDYSVRSCCLCYCTLLHPPLNMHTNKEDYISCLTWFTKWLHRRENLSTLNVWINTQMLTGFIKLYNNVIHMHTFANGRHKWMCAKEPERQRERDRLDTLPNVMEILWSDAFCTVS